MADVIKLLEMRMALETEIAGLAAIRRTDENLADSANGTETMRASAISTRRSPPTWPFTARSPPPRATTIISAHGFPRHPAWCAAAAFHARDGSIPSTAPMRGEIYRDHESIPLAITAQDATRARLAARRHMKKSLERHRRGSAYQKTPD